MKRLYVLIKALFLFGPRKVWKYDLGLLYSYRAFQKVGVGFIHVPKAAGVALWREVYGLNPCGHWGIRDYEELDEGAASITWFAVIRHPADRFQSAFHYLKSEGRGTKMDKMLANRLKPYKDADALALALHEDHEMRELEHFRPMSSWLVGSTARLTVFRLEDSDKLNEWLTSQGMHPLTKRHNVSVRPSLDSLSSRSLEILKDVYSSDYELYRG